MMIGKIKIGSLNRKPKDPRYRNPFAHKNCDCADCADIVRHDAWFIYNDNEGITDQRLVDAVSELNGWIEE